MSRELLKEIAEVFRERRGGITWAAEPLLGKIETELAKPEPEPVAYEYTSTCGNKFATHTPPQYARNIRPLYTTPPDQSARIAELEAELAQAYKTVDENWVCHQQLAALQAKREPLSDKEVVHLAIKMRSTFNAAPFARAIEAAHGIGE